MFHMLPCSMQCEAGLVLPRIFNSDHLLRNRIDRELAELLKDLTDVLVRRTVVAGAWVAFFQRCQQ